MNLIMASVLLLAMLAFQPTLIYGTKNLASARTNGGSISASSSISISNRNIRSSKYGKRHSTESLLHPPSSSLTAAKLVLSMESGDVLVRSARGAATDLNPNVNPTTAKNDGSKRPKYNNKKLNKNLNSHEPGTSSSTSSTTSTSSNTNRRKHAEKKFSAASGLSNNQKQQSNGNGNKGNKQRQMLKSQNHQNKRSGGGNKAANRESVEKTQSESEKTSATCRYVKSAWSECDPKTNMRTRSLTLKKGEANCPETRTMQKNCKKSCRYEKGAWSECTNGQMTREDKLKSTGGVESSCEPVRSINKKCNPNNGGSNKQSGGGGGGKKERKNKEKGSRRVVKN